MFNEEILDIVKEITGKEVYIQNSILLYADDSDVEQYIIDEATNIINKYKSSLNYDIKIKESLDYLSSTDFYYIRRQETGEEIPTEVVTKEHNQEII